MGAEVDGVCGADYGERYTDRVNRRNGYRERPWDTRAGTIALQVPKLREGTYFPDSENGSEGWSVASDSFPD